jgi:Zn finger protein HypA/HybF involved in hydrogenase expression
MDCVTYFYPKYQDYECPKCGGKTRPSQLYDPSKHEIYKPLTVTSKEQKCPKCSTVMVSGLITEAAENIVGLYHHGSVRWTANGPRFIFPPVNSVFPTAYACPECGKIELYIQFADEKEKLQEEKITKWAKQPDLRGYCNDCKTDYDFYEHGFFCPTCKKKNTEKKSINIE